MKFKTKFGTIRSITPTIALIVSLIVAGGIFYNADKIQINKKHHPQEREVEIIEENEGTTKEQEDADLIFSYIKKRDFEDVQSLVASGAKFNIHNEDGISPLGLAIINNDLKMVQTLVDNGVDINFIQKLKSEYPRYSPILIAIDTNNNEIAKYLISNGADTKTTSTYGAGPIHFAAKHGNVELVKYFIEDKKVSVESKDRSNQTPLYYAAYGNQVEMLEYLLNKGANLYATIETSGGEKTALHNAISPESVDAILYLNEKGLDVDSKKYKSTVLSATYYNAPKSLEALLKLGANPNIEDKKGKPALYIASGFGNIEIVKVLVKNGANLNKSYRKTTPLMHAIYSYKLETAKFLLKSGANVNAANSQGDRAIHLASIKNDPELINLLIEKGANVNEKGTYEMTPIYGAISSNNLEIAKILIANGAKVNVALKFNKEGYYKDVFNGATPLMMAVSTQYDLVKLLVDNGAKINTKSNDDMTALDIYYLGPESKKGDIKILNYLLEKGAKISHRTKANTYTDLGLAAKYGDKKSVEILLKRGCKIDEKDNDGMSALAMACENGNFEVAKFLVEKGADVNSRDERGATPLMRSAESGNYELFKYLISKKANIHVVDLDKDDVMTSAIRSLVYTNEDTDYYSIIRYILDNGYDTSKEKRYGCTTLEYIEREKRDYIRYRSPKEEIDILFEKVYDLVQSDKKSLRKKMVQFFAKLYIM